MRFPVSDRPFFRLFEKDSKLFFSYNFESFYSQFQSHRDQLLKSRQARTKALRVSAVFDESGFLIQGQRSRIFGNRIQLKLNIPRLSRAFDTSLHQGVSDSESPKCLRNADAKPGAVAHLVLFADRFDSCSSDDDAIDNRNELNLIWAFGFCL